MPIVAAPSAAFSGGTLTKQVAIANTDAQTSLIVSPSSDALPLFLRIPAGAVASAIQVKDQNNENVLLLTEFSATIGETTDCGVGFDMSTANGFRLWSDTNNDSSPAIRVRRTGGTQQLGFYGNSTTAQPAAIPAAAGGVVIDAEARSALNALLTANRALGLIAT